SWRPCPTASSRTAARPRRARPSGSAPTTPRRRGPSAGSACCARPSTCCPIWPPPPMSTRSWPPRGPSLRAGTNVASVTPEDLEFLRTAAGRDLLDLAAGLAWSRADLVASTAAVRRADAVHAAAAIDVVTARARARGRIRGAGAMLLTDEAVQQATAWPVAALRAGRLAGRDVHDVTCSVGAELTELVRTADRVIGSDLDPVRARMAAHNVPDALVCVADALAPPSRDAVLVADPARRSAGRRVHDPARL